MFQDGFSQRLPQRRRNGIAYHPADCGSVERLAGLEKLVVLGKTLQEGGFAQGHGTILFGMPEATVAQAHAEGGDGRRGAIPPHSSVDGNVAGSAFPAIAIGQEFFRPILTAPTVMGSMADSTQVHVRKLGRHVQPVGRVFFPASQRRQ